MDGKNSEPVIKFELQQTAKKTCSCCGLLGCIVFQNGTQTAKLCGCQNEVIYFHWINFFFSFDKILLFNKLYFTVLFLHVLNSHFHLIFLFKKGFIKLYIIYLIDYYFIRCKYFHSIKSLGNGWPCCIA